MGDCGQDTTSPKLALVDRKYSPLSNVLDRGHDLQGRLECPQDRLETIQPICRQYPPLLHTDKFPEYMGDLPLASLHTDFSWQQNGAGQICQ
jgi:hypothetical protein